MIGAVAQADPGPPSQAGAGKAVQAGLRHSNPAANQAAEGRAGSEQPLARTPLVAAHRGASGYRPEHTLAAYRLAIKLGADYIEPDLVATKDGVLVARHENEISGTTDVADHPEFADRKTAKTIDGREITGWFTEDFTLAELRTLRAKERLPDLRPKNTRFDGEFEVPTFQEVIDLTRKESRRTGRTIGIYPETKHPTYFQSIGLPLEPPLLATLRANDLANADSPVIIQSFETANLRAMDQVIDVPLAQIINSSGQPYDFTVSGDPRTYQDLAKPKGLRWISGYADLVSFNKNMIVPRDSSGKLLEPTSLISDAHAEGLLVHAWTFRNENTFLPADFRKGSDPAAWGDAAAEYELFYGLGLDGLFSDFPDAAVAARDA
ncbi:MAG: glycerophosphodiester phosphodiesterase [Micromonosporaceae bacterium]|nr:glycerophosphodiester phosphodiesterase [Micromonosporaceae bacterium]